jgi:hypothetical protein
MIGIVSLGLCLDEGIVCGVLWTFIKCHPTIKTHICLEGRSLITILGKHEIDSNDTGNSVSVGGNMCLWCQCCIWQSSAQD